jgi:hypothetical protein
MVRDDAPRTRALRALTRESSTRTRLVAPQARNAVKRNRRSGLLRRVRVREHREGMGNEVPTPASSPETVMRLAGGLRVARAGLLSLTRLLARPVAAAWPTDPLANLPSAARH